MIQHIYIAACESDGGIYHYILRDNGTLQIKEKTALPHPMYLAIDDSTMHVLLRAPFDDSPDSGILSLSVDRDGSLHSPTPIVSTKGVVGCHLSTLRHVIYAANYSSGSVIRLPEPLVVHKGHGVDPERQEQAHAHFISPTPDGCYLLACDLGTDEIITYDPALNHVSAVSAPSGSGPRHLTFSADGRYVYCACELSSELAVFSYKDGKLTFLRAVTTLPEDFVGESYPAAIRRYGNHVYVSNRGHDSVTVFRADGAEVTIEAYIPTHGSWPRDFDRFGDFLISTNERENNVTVQKLDSDFTAVPTETVADIPAPLCVIGLSADE